jgi:hypothetical protein
MNIAFALDYIPRRMSEMGYDDRYVTRYRHVRVEKATSITFKAHNQLMILIEPEVLNIKVESDRGVFNLGDTTINIQQHEHSGVVKVTNDTDLATHVLFIQVIPQHKKLSKT